MEYGAFTVRSTHSTSSRDHTFFALQTFEVMEVWLHRLYVHNRFHSLLFAIISGLFDQLFFNNMKGEEAYSTLLEFS